MESILMAIKSGDKIIFFTTRLFQMHNIRTKQPTAMIQTGGVIDRTSVTDVIDVGIAAQSCKGSVWLAVPVHCLNSLLVRLRGRTRQQFLRIEQQGMDGGINRRMDRQTNRWMDGQTNRQKNRQRQGQISSYSTGLCPHLDRCPLLGPISKNGNQGLRLAWEI